MLTSKQLIESTMVDFNQKMKMSEIFGLFQNYATNDAEAIGHGKDKTTNAGKLWVLTRIYCEVAEYPTYLSESIATTYATEKRGFAFPRKFKIEGSDGHLQVRLSSIWALIDKESRKLIFKPDLPEFEAHHEDDELPDPTKVTTSQASFIYQREVKYSDIDLNGHLNNCRYIEFILDSLPLSLFKQKEIASLLINYETETAPGETIMMYGNDDYTYICGRTTEKVCFEANLTYR